VEDEQAEAMLLAVLDHYGFPEPGWGERPARCPVHDETHPSASINRAKGLFNCHACGAGGDAATIVMARENVEYRDAMAFIEGLGVDVRPTRPAVRKSGAAKRGGRWVPPRLRGAS